MDSRLLTFLSVSGLLIVTPGPDMATVTKNALAHGRRGALGTALGIGTALLAHATAAALGLSALLQAAGALFGVIKLSGAAYLVYLGVQALWAARSTAAGASDPISPIPRRGGSPYRQGLLSALLNPKLLVFFSTFLPQFADPQYPLLPQLLALGLLFDGLGLLWLIGYGLCVMRLRTFFAAARVRRQLERFTGLVLVALGLRLAFERT